MCGTRIYSETHGMCGILLRIIWSMADIQLPFWTLFSYRLLPIDDFKRFLFCKKFAIITLVNARLLRCQWCLVSEDDVDPISEKKIRSTADIDP